MCHKGDLPTLRHKEIRDLTAGLLSEVSTGVSVEPPLQALGDEEFSLRSANREDQARLDLRASDFWVKGREAFFDVRVFYPVTPSYCQKELSAIYKLHENEKKRCYGQRVREVERASFTPLVFSSTGGIAKESKIVFKRIAYILADKKMHFSEIMYMIHCKISFALVRSAVCAIRGSRSRPFYSSLTDFSHMYVC